MQILVLWGSVWFVVHIHTWLWCKCVRREGVHANKGKTAHIHTQSQKCLDRLLCSHVKTVAQYRAQQLQLRCCHDAQVPRWTLWVQSSALLPHLTANVGSDAWVITNPWTYRWNSRLLALPWLSQNYCRFESTDGRWQCLSAFQINTERSHFYSI